MKRLLKSKLARVVGVLLLSIFLVNWGLRLVCNKSYYDLVSNRSLISAFISGDEELINSVVKANDLVFQQIRGGKIVFESRSSLPKLKVVSYKQRVADGVILPDASESLRHQQPYRMVIGKSIYVMAPMCGVDCKNDIYLVYKRAVL